MKYSKLFAVLLLVFAMFAIALGAQTSVNASATVNGQTATGTVAVTWQSKLTLALACPSATLLSGNIQTCTATLNQPAPAGGAVVNLTSGDPTKISVPSSVTVPSGATAANFTVTAL